MKLSELPNIGQELERRLESVGIDNPNDLKKIGSLEAVKKVRGELNTGCLNMLYALEGAIRGTRWHNLSTEDKKELKDKLSDIISKV